jgi:hypothetical protein
MRKLLSGLSFAILLIATAFSMHAQAPGSAAPASQSFSSPAGRFSALFAGTPKQDSQTIQLKGGGSTTLYQFWVELENNNISYMIMYNDYTADYANGDPQSVLVTTRDGAVSGKTLLSDAVINLNGVPGRAFTATDPNGWNYTVHQFLKGKRLYQLIVVSTAAHPATLTDQFMSSFSMW